MKIKILDWNVYNRNRGYLKITELIKNSNADIICLQEASESLIDILRKLQSYSIFTAMDFYEDGSLYYLATLIKSNLIANSNLIQLGINKNTSKQGKKYNWIEGIEAQFIDITIDKTTLRVYNIHLSAGCSPEIRKMEMHKCFQTINKGITNVLCGDFNTSANPAYNIFMGRLFNFSIRDYFTNEGNRLRKELMKYNLRSGFDKGKTEDVEIISSPIKVKFPLISDYILLSNSIKVLSKQIYSDSFGSDHKLLEMVIEIPE